MLYGYSVYMLTKLVICSGHLFARIDQSALECPHFTYPSLHACHQERRTDEVIMSTMSGVFICFVFYQANGARKIAVDEGRRGNAGTSHKY